MGKTKDINNLVHGDQLLDSDFSTEKEMDDWFFENITSYFFAITGKKPAVVTRQYNLSKVKTSETSRQHALGRADFLVVDEVGQDWLIELKNPTANIDLLQGVVQLLYYQDVFKKLEYRKAKLLLISSKMDNHFGDFAKRFKKQVGFYVLNRKTVFNIISYGKTS